MTNFFGADDSVPASANNFVVGRGSSNKIFSQGVDVMGDKIDSVVQNLAMYLAFIFVGTWIIDAILGPSKEIDEFSAFQVCLLQWSFFRALLILFVTYVLYFAVAGGIANVDSDGSGKIAVIIAGVFLVLRFVFHMSELLVDDTGLVASSGLTFAALIFSLQDIAQIIATFHGFAEGGK